MPDRPSSYHALAVTRRRLLTVSASALAAVVARPVRSQVLAAPASPIVRQDQPPPSEPASPSLAERWVIPDGLPKLPTVTAEAVFAGDIGSGQVLFEGRPVSINPMGSEKSSVRAASARIVSGSRRSAGI